MDESNGPLAGERVAIPDEDAYGVVIYDDGDQMKIRIYGDQMRWFEASKVRLIFPGGDVQN